MDSFNTFRSRFKAVALENSASFENYILEAHLKTSATRTLLYFPDIETIFDFIASIDDIMSFLPGNIIILIDDSLYEARLLEYRLRIGKLIGMNAQITQANKEKVFLFSYSRIMTLENSPTLFQPNKIGKITVIVFDDVKHINKFLDISRVLKNVIDSVPISVAVTSSPFLFFDYYNNSTKKYFACYAPVFHDVFANYYGRLIRGFQMVYYDEKADTVKRKKSPLRMVIEEIVFFVDRINEKYSKIRPCVKDEMNAKDINNENAFASEGSRIGTDVLPCGTDVSYASVNSTDKLCSHYADWNSGSLEALNGLKTDILYMEKQNIFDSAFVLSHKHCYLLPEKIVRILRQKMFRSEKLSKLFKLLNRIDEKCAIVFTDLCLLNYVKSICNLQLQWNKSNDEGANSSLTPDELPSPAFKSNSTDQAEGTKELFEPNLLPIDNLHASSAVSKLMFIMGHELFKHNADLTSIIFFDYYPFFTSVNSYLLCHLSQSDFFNAILAVEQKIELEIKPTFNYDNYFVGFMTSKQEDVEYRILKYEAPCEDKLVKGIKKSGNTYLARICSSTTAAHFSSFLTKRLNYPLVPCKLHRISSSVFLSSSTLSFGTLTSFNTFVNPYTFTGEGFCFFDSKFIAYYMFSKKHRIKVRVCAESLEQYILFDSTNSAANIYICLKVLPDIFFTNENYPKDVKFNAVENLKWNRVSKNEVPFLENRGDICIRIHYEQNMGTLIDKFMQSFGISRNSEFEQSAFTNRNADNEKPSGLMIENNSNRLVEANVKDKLEVLSNILNCNNDGKTDDTSHDTAKYIDENSNMNSSYVHEATSSIKTDNVVERCGKLYPRLFHKGKHVAQKSSTKHENNVRCKLSSDLNSCQMAQEALYCLLNKYQNITVVFTTIRRFTHSKLSVSDIHNTVSSFDFDSLYYILCLLSRKGRFLDNQLEQKDLDRIGCDVKSMCLYMDSSLRTRFTDVPELMFNFKPFEISTNKFQIRSAIITPLFVFYNFPKISDTNRVLREFDSEKFLRISLREQDTKSKLGTNYNNTLVYNFYRSLLIDGVFIGRRKYFFLAMTTSQMKLHSSWFITPYFDDGVLIGPDYIRTWLGDFSSIKNIGKYAIRLGQALSSTTETIKIEKFHTVPDIYRDGYCFTDGVGLINLEYARQVSKILKLNDVPSALQIRFGGFKGVVVVHPWLSSTISEIKQTMIRIRKRQASSLFYTNSEVHRCHEAMSHNPNVLSQKGVGRDTNFEEIFEYLGHGLVLRQSMKKFDSTHRTLEVVAYSSSGQLYLNRQLIIILEALGIPSHVFIRLQDEYIISFISESINSFSTLIRQHCGLINQRSISPNYTFFRRLYLPIANKLVESLATKSRIFVPKGRSVIGVIDELNVLEEDEVFLMTSINDNDLVYLNKTNYAPHVNLGVNWDVKDIQDAKVTTSQNSVIIYGSYMVINCPVVIVKNPCLHPGDVRVVNAVDKPELHYLKNVLVFSKKGKRPVFNMCSGSDLDGDVYSIIWDEDLRPKELQEPCIYNSDTMLTKDIVSMKDIVNFYINYMQSFTLGSIANSHLVYCDKHSVLSPDAIRLAHLFNRGVDFPKTGFVARVPTDLIPVSYPDFMQKKTGYRSKKICGILYRRAMKLLMNVRGFCECKHCLFKEVESLRENIAVFLSGIDIYARYIDMSSGIQEDTVQASSVFTHDDASYAAASQIYESYKHEISILMSKYHYANEEDLFLNMMPEQADATTCLQDLKRVIKSYKCKISKCNFDLMVWYKVSNYCTSSFKSLFWIINDSYKIEKFLKIELLDITTQRNQIEKPTRVVNINSEETFNNDINFIFNSKIIAKHDNLSKDRTYMATSKTDLLNFTMEEIIKLIGSKPKFLKLSVANPNFGNIFITYGNITLYSKFIASINPQLNDIYTEVYTLLMLMEVLPVNNLNYIILFFRCLNVRVEACTREGVSNALISLSKIFIDEITTECESRRSNTVPSINVEKYLLYAYQRDYELVSSNLILTSFLLCIDISIIYKAKIAIGAIKFQKINNTKLPTTSSTVITSLICIGMFDENDELCLEVYCGEKNKHHSFDVYSPNLLNKGQCSIDNYKDVLCDFMTAYIFSAKNNYNTLYTTIITPGKLYFYNLPTVYLTKPCTIKQLNDLVNNSSVSSNKSRSYFHNFHPLCQPEREQYANQIGLVFDVKWDFYQLSISHNQFRYEIHMIEVEENFLVYKITRGRRLLNKFHILGQGNYSGKLNSDTCFEVIKEDVVWWAVEFNELCTFRHYSHAKYKPEETDVDSNLHNPSDAKPMHESNKGLLGISNDLLGSNERFFLEPNIISRSGNDFKVNPIVQKNNGLILRLEHNTSITSKNELPVSLTYKRIFLLKNGMLVESQKRVSTNSEIEVYERDIVDYSMFSEYFEVVWQDFLRYFN